MTSAPGYRRPDIPSIDTGLVFRDLRRVHGVIWLAVSFAIVGLLLYRDDVVMKAC